MQLDNNGACDGDFGGPMTFFNTSDYPGYYTQIGVIQPFLSHICGNPKVPDILTRLEDVEVLDFIYENSLNEKKYNSEDYATKDEEKDYEYPEYETAAIVADEETKKQEEHDENDIPKKDISKEVNEVINPDKKPCPPINLRKSTDGC